MVHIYRIFIEFYRIFQLLTPKKCGLIAKQQYRLCDYMITWQSQCLNFLNCVKRWLQVPWTTTQPPPRPPLPSSLSSLGSISKIAGSETSCW